jgi:hypothetical protein
LAVALLASKRRQQGYGRAKLASRQVFFAGLSSGAADALNLGGLIDDALRDPPSRIICSKTFISEHGVSLSVLLTSVKENSATGRIDLVLSHSF